MVVVVVCVVVHFFCWWMHAFVVVSLVFSTPSQEIGVSKCLRSDLFCVEWNVKPPLNQSVMSVRLSLSFHSSFWTNRPLTLTVCTSLGHDESSPGIESLVHGPRSRVRVMFMISKDGNTVGLTSVLDRGQFFLVPHQDGMQHDATDPCQLLWRPTPYCLCQVVALIFLLTRVYRRY